MSSSSECNRTQQSGDFDDQQFEQYNMDDVKYINISIYSPAKRGYDIGNAPIKALGHFPPCFGDVHTSCVRKGNRVKLRMWNCPGTSKQSESFRGEHKTQGGSSYSKTSKQPESFRGERRAQGGSSSSRTSKQSESFRGERKTQGSLGYKPFATGSLADKVAYKEQKFILAARYGLANRLPFFVNIDCNAINDDNYTALMTAACYGHADCITMLYHVFDSKIDVNMVNGDNQTALELAIKNGHTKCAMKLCVLFGDKMHTNLDKILVGAVSNCYGDVLLALHKYCNQRINWESGDLLESNILFKINFNQHELFKILHECWGSILDINARDLNGKTILMHVVEYNNSDAIKTIHECWGDKLHIEEVDNNNRNVLSMTTDSECLKVLLDCLLNCF